MKKYCFSNATNHVIKFKLAHVTCYARIYSQHFKIHKDSRHKYQIGKSWQLQFINRGTSSEGQSSICSLTSLPLGDHINPSIIPENLSILSPNIANSLHPLWPRIISSILIQLEAWNFYFLKKKWKNIYIWQITTSH